LQGTPLVAWQSQFHGGRFKRSFAWLNSRNFGYKNGLQTNKYGRKQLLI
jgi:hypothetical protein